MMNKDYQDWLKKKVAKSIKSADEKRSSSWEEALNRIRKTANDQPYFRKIA